jgi:hypothetical protein
MLQNQGAITVTVYPDGQDHPETARTFEQWRGFTGDGSAGNGQYIRPGSMAPGEAVPGPQEFGERTLTKWVRFERDSGLSEWLLVNIGARMVAVDQPLDAKRRAGFHKPLTYSGILNGVTPPDYDADSTDPAELTITIMVDGIS